MKFFRLVLLVFVLAGCQKAQRDEDTSVNTCEDIALAQTIFADAYKQIRIAALNTKGISDAQNTLTTIYGCEEIKADTLSQIKHILIDYKYIGCEGMGVDRYGRLVADFFGKFGEEGSGLDIIFSNYFYQEYEVNGSIRILFKEKDNQGREVETFYLQNGTITDGSSSMSWTASQVWTVNDTPVETYEISGNNNGINRKGNTFKSVMTSNHLMSEDCLFTLSGKQEVDTKNLSRRFLDFGNGNCDEHALVRINGASYSVSIP